MHKKKKTHQNLLHPKKILFMAILSQISMGNFDVFVAQFQQEVLFYFVILSAVLVYVDEVVKFLKNSSSFKEYNKYTLAYRVNQTSAPFLTQNQNESASPNDEVSQKF